MIFHSTIQNDMLTHTKVSIGDILVQVYYLHIREWHRLLSLATTTAERRKNEKDQE